MCLRRHPLLLWADDRRYLRQFNVCQLLASDRAQASAAALCIIVGRLSPAVDDQAPQLETTSIP